MTVRIGYEVGGVRRVDSRLAGIELAGQNLFSAFVAAADLLEVETRRQFESEGAYGSGGWKPLSEQYAAWKATHYPGEPILQREHDLYDSLTATEHPEAIRDITPFGLTFGTSVPYAKYHQVGTDRMPARPPLVMREAMGGGGGL